MTGQRKASGLADGKRPVQRRIAIVLYLAGLSLFPIWASDPTPLTDGVPWWWNAIWIALFAWAVAWTFPMLKQFSRNPTPRTSIAIAVLGVALSGVGTILTAWSYGLLAVLAMYPLAGGLTRRHLSRQVSMGNAFGQRPDSQREVLS